jgi:hypothetical protein
MTHQRSTTLRWSEYHDDDEDCDETRCSLLVYTGKTSPDEVTRRLGIEPSELGIAGQVVVNSLGRTRTTKLNYWFLDSEGNVTSKDLRRHLDWLLGILTPVGPALAELQATPGVTMTVRCVWWSRAGRGGPALSPEQMAALAALNLECGFDFCYYPDQDSAT